MDADRLLLIALVHWQAWDDATRDAWTETWDRVWEGTDEREPASGA